MNKEKWETSRRWKRQGNELSSRASRREHKKQTRSKTETESKSEAVIIIRAKEEWSHSRDGERWVDWINI